MQSLSMPCMQHQDAAHQGGDLDAMKPPELGDAPMPPKERLMFSRACSCSACMVLALNSWLRLMISISLAHTQLLSKTWHLMHSSCAQCLVGDAEGSRHL